MVVQIAIRYRVFMSLQLLKANNSLFASTSSFEKKICGLFVYFSSSYVQISCRVKYECAAFSL